MTQTEKSQKNPTQKRLSPGQRQQARQQRLLRRQRRQRILISSIVSVVVIVAAILGILQYQNYTAQVTANNNAAATKTAEKNANATATVTAQDCFVSPPGTKTSDIYSGSATPSAGPATAPRITGTPVKLKDGLQYIDIKVGTGPEVKAGQTANVEYTGWLQSTCQKFDSSYDRGGQTFPLSPFGQAQVIPGWNEGLMGMKVGGTRRILLPPALAYGAQGSPPTIPANATLIFDVTIVSAK